jgi:hypothetical protein
LQPILCPLQKGDAMKVRISGNSLRFRVSRSDLASLQSGKRVQTTIHFAPQPDANFTYVLERSVTVQSIAVRYLPGEVTAILPTAQADLWSATDQVGIYETLNIGNAETLDLIIEKDFACIDGSDAQNVDTFPNPSIAC